MQKRKKGMKVRPGADQPTENGKPSKLIRKDKENKSTWKSSRIPRSDSEHHSKAGSNHGGNEQVPPTVSDAGKNSSSDERNDITNVTAPSTSPSEGTESQPVLDRGVSNDRNERDIDAGVSQDHEGNDLSTNSSPAAQTNNASVIPLKSIRDRRNRDNLRTRNKSPSNAGSDWSGSRESQYTVGNTINPSNIEMAFNNCKAELRDAKRDKRVYISFYETEKAKNEELLKEKTKLLQRVTALEMTISKKGKRFTKQRGRWSARQSTGSAREKYHGVFISLLHDINKSANLSVTESYFNETAGCIVRNWTGTSTRVSAQTALKAGCFVYLPCGTNAIPHCPMKIAQRREFYTLPFNNVTKYIQHRTKLMLQKSGFDHMPPTTKDDCLNVMISDPEVVSRHKYSLSEAVSQRKKHAKVTFLKALGYNAVCKPVPVKGEDPFVESRREERQEVHNRCIFRQGSGELDTMYWRVSKWEDICKETMESSNLSREMKSADANAKVDYLFSNQAARLAFKDFKGYDFSPSNINGCNDSSILTLARADSWMTTALEYIVLEGKGGKRNNQFSDSFQTLIPVALSNIIKEIWSDLKEMASDELKPRLGRIEENEEDPYDNLIRDYTAVFKSPHDDCLYLVATSKYFRENVCCWLGEVKDCFIGRCDTNATSFTRIDVSMSFEDETSFENESDSIETDSVEDS